MLFKFNFSPGFFELLLESFSISLSKTFLDSVRSTIYEILSFLQAQTGKFLNELNDSELAGTCALQYYVERSLFLGSGSTGSRTGSNSYSGSGRFDAIFFLQNFSKFVYFSNGEIY